MNPNGILFGPSSSLDLQGAFAGTTANSIQFGEQGIFSASSPAVPTQLLVVSPSAYLFSQPESAGIRSLAQNLTLSPSQSFTLLGGDITFQNGFIQAPLGGEIELGSIADTGIVPINGDSGSPRLDFKDGISRGNIDFTRAGIALSGEGRIGIYTQDINLRDTSGIFSFLFLNSEILDIQVPNFGGLSGADIIVNATGDVTLTDLSFIASGAFGDSGLSDRENSGSIEISSNSVNVINTSFIASAIVGRAEPGNITIKADDSITLSGRASDESFSAIGSPAGSLPGLFGVGNGGDVTLRASRITLKDEARISNISNAGAENAGNIDIFASDTLMMSNGAFFSTETLGEGNAGFIKVHANNLLSLDGVGTNGNVTGFFSAVNPSENSQASRQGGDITVTTLPSGSFNMTNGARISGNVESGAIGEAGSIDIRVGNMNMTNGSQVQSLLREGNSSNGLAGAQGRAGDLSIIVNNTLATSEQGSNTLPSGFFTNANTGTVGDAGDITVDAEILNLERSAISSITQSSGNAGFLDIQAQDIQLSNDTLITSATFGSGEGNSIRINADRLVARGGGQISAGSGRENISGDFGRSGNIDITVTDLLELDGSGTENRSGIFAETSSFKRAGDLTINTGRLIVRDGAAVSASASGSGSLGGDSGILTLHASESVDILGSGQRSSALVTEANGIGNAGDLLLTTNRLTVRDGGVITSATRGQGNTGDIEISASNINVLGTDVTGEPSGIIATIEADAAGESGTIRIQTENLTIEDGGRISAASFTEDAAGNIVIDATGRIVLRNSEIATTATRSSGGDILINTDQQSSSGILFLERDGDITTESLRDGGNITLLLPVIALEDSDISARSQSETGGDIAVSALFSDTMSPSSETNNRANEGLDNNGRSDLSATGAISSGTISAPDTSFVQNSLSELSDNLANTEHFVASSCIARDDTSSSFIISSIGTVLKTPESSSSIYPTGTVRSASIATSSAESAASDWQLGDPIEEPSNVYQLSDGRLVLGQSCADQ